MREQEFFGEKANRIENDGRYNEARRFDRAMQNTTGHVYAGWKPREGLSGWWLVAIAMLVIGAFGIADQLRAERENPAASYVGR